MEENHSLADPYRVWSQQNRCFIKDIDIVIELRYKSQKWLRKDKNTRQLYLIYFNF